MSKKYALLVVALLTLFSFFPITNASPQVSAEGLTFQVVFPQNKEYKVGTPFELTFHLYNTSGIAVSNNSLLCQIHVYNSTNAHVSIMNVTVNNSASMDLEWFAPPAVYDKVGSYPYVFACNSTGIGGYVSDEFFVTPEGKVISNNSGISMIALTILIGLILAFAGVSTIYLFQQQHPLFYLSSVLTTLFVTVISFITWRVAAEAAYSFQSVFLWIFIVFLTLTLIHVFVVMIDVSQYVFEVINNKRKGKELERFGYVNEKGRI